MSACQVGDEGSIPSSRTSIVEVPIRESKWYQRGRKIDFPFIDEILEYGSICGGFARWCTGHNKEYTDVDVYPFSKTHAKALVKVLNNYKFRKMNVEHNYAQNVGATTFRAGHSDGYGGWTHSFRDKRYIIQIVEDYRVAESIISDYDFTVTQAFLKDKADRVYVTQAFLEDSAANLIKLNKFTSPLHPDIDVNHLVYNRILKYFQKGFKITFDDLLEFLSHSSEDGRENILALVLGMKSCSEMDKVDTLARMGKIQL